MSRNPHPANGAGPHAVQAHGFLWGLVSDRRQSSRNAEERVDELGSTLVPFSAVVVSIALCFGQTASADGIVGSGAKSGEKAPAAKPAVPKKASAPYAQQPKHPGALTLKRAGHRQTLALRDGNKITPEALETLAEVLKHKSGQKHAVDPRLAELLATVSDHFGGRTIDVVDGFRPPPGHSNHNLGRAIDFRIEGVQVDAVRDFCQSLDHAGVGSYPGGKFIHLDWRRKGRSWTDDTPPARAARSVPAAPLRAGSSSTPMAPPQPPKIKTGTPTSPVHKPSGP